MADYGYAKQIADLLEQALTLIRQELVTLRNDVVVQKIEHEGFRTRVAALEAKKNPSSEDTSAQTSKLIVAVIGALITGFSALIIALVQHFNK